MMFLLMSLLVPLASISWLTVSLRLPWRRVHLRWRSFQSKISSAIRMLRLSGEMRRRVNV